jgi:hypothetical protein
MGKKKSKVKKLVHGHGQEIINAIFNQKYLPDFCFQTSSKKHIRQIKSNFRLQNFFCPCRANLLSGKVFK